MEEFSPGKPILVALAGWILPGSGYLIIGQRSRGITIGLTIIILFFLGLLIGGVRELEVPGYGPTANKIRVASRGGFGASEAYASDDLEEGPWVMTRHPLDEIRNKPWSIPQIMMGPIDLLCDMWSLQASQRVSEASHAIGTRSHSRTNEIGVLYTAVAGLLNLLAIIDSAYRAGQGGEAGKAA